MDAAMSQRRLDACHGNAPLPHLWLTGAGLWACINAGASEHGATALDAWRAAMAGRVLTIQGHGIGGKGVNLER